MSKWDEFKGTVETAARKTAQKTAELTDLAATKVKIKTAEARLCEKYETLGRLYYETMQDETGVPEAIRAARKAVAAEQETIEALKRLYEQKKEGREPEKTENGGTENGGTENALF